MKFAGLLLLFAFAAPTAGAEQAVYRCGPDGRDYASEPCPDGRRIDVSDARTPGEREAARQVARDDARRAEQLVLERHAREAQGRPAAGFHAAGKSVRAAQGSVERKPKAPKPPKQPKTLPAAKSADPPHGKKPAKPKRVAAPAAAQP